MSFGLGELAASAATGLKNFVAPVTDALGMTGEGVTTLAGEAVGSMGGLQAAVDAGQLSAAQIAELPQSMLANLNFSNVAPGALGTNAIGGTLGAGSLDVINAGATNSLLNGTQATQGLGTLAGSGNQAAGGNLIKDYIKPTYDMYTGYNQNKLNARAADQQFGMNEENRQYVKEDRARAEQGRADDAAVANDYASFLNS